MLSRPLTKKEYDNAIIQIVDTLLSPAVKAGKHRKKQWEAGWKQNLKEGSLTPHYFGKYKVNRFNGKLVMALSKDYEQKALYGLLDSLFSKYLRDAEHIYEFGCGTGHNLLRARLFNRKAKLYGLDWAKSSQKILKKLGITGYNFDFFNPGKLKLEPKSAIYTVAALEQTGKNYKKFVSYILENKPSVCLHVEPIEELLDSENLLDNLSLKYFKKRRYLSGYLTYLRELEKNKKIKILEAKRSGIGSLFVEGYSIIVWKPTDTKESFNKY